MNIRTHMINFVGYVIKRSTFGQLVAIVFVHFTKPVLITLRIDGFVPFVQNWMKQRKIK